MVDNERLYVCDWKDSRLKRISSPGPLYTLIAELLYNISTWRNNDSGWNFLSAVFIPFFQIIEICIKFAGHLKYYDNRELQISYLSCLWKKNKQTQFLVSVQLLSSAPYINKKD